MNLLAWVLLFALFFSAAFLTARLLIAHRAQQVTAIPESPECPETVVVRQGDNLWKLSVRHLDDGRRWREIAELNEIKDTLHLLPGTVLRMPRP